MKKVFIFLSLVAFMGCKKDYKSIYSFPVTEDKASIKIVHALANAFATPTSTAQSGLQVYINDVKVTGNAVTFGGGVFPGLEYALVPSGTVNAKVVIPAGATNAEIVAVNNAPLTLEAGQTYTAFITDTIPNASIFTIKEDFSPVADSGKYFVRLVNATPKSAGYDLYAVTDAVTIASNVQYKSASPYVQIFAGTGARTFAIRKPGTTTNIATVAITPTARRMYTIFSYGIDGGTGARAPKLQFFTARFQK
ncbi:MAG TPA: DUF4397 domain-containing protein [Chitinophagaceae bacterium]|nr:DUF4397 domain-containing protein [Chitinophagaceae bacterium]